MKKAEYMESYVGTEYEVTISSITRFGFFVSLPNTIEGLVHMSTLGDDFYNFNERDLILKGHCENLEKSCLFSLSVLGALGRMIATIK